MTQNKIEPVISIITVVYNGGSTLEKTILSVIEQTYPNIEYVIIDGGSTDNSVNLIKKHENKIAVWLSEPDLGIYHAMNKGIDLANGQYLYFLGSDDIMMDSNIIYNVVTNIKKFNECDLIYGRIIYDGKNIYTSTISAKTLLHNTLHHQAVFYNYKLFNNFRYDTKYKYIADYELNLLIYINKQRLKIVKMTEIIANCEDAGRSRVNLEQAYNETNSIRKKVLGKIKSLIPNLLYYIKFSIIYKSSIIKKYVI